MMMPEEDMTSPQLMKNDDDSFKEKLSRDDRKNDDADDRFEADASNERVWQKFRAINVAF
jgi:hypothetical protein